VVDKVMVQAGVVLGVMGVQVVVGVITQMGVTQLRVKEMTVVGVQVFWEPLVHTVIRVEVVEERDRPVDRVV
jgi:hypothetical protein